MSEEFDGGNNNIWKVIFDGCNHEHIMSAQEFLKLKEKQNEQKKQLRLKTLKKIGYREIEMLKVVLHLISRDN